MNPVASTMLKASIGLSNLAKDHFGRIRSAIGDARVVLIGEETHGTQEFYALRAEITKALIEHEGFSLVLCESDFPTFYKLHRFVGGTHASRDSLASSSSASGSGGSVSPRSATATDTIHAPPLSPSASTPLLAADAKTPAVPSYGTVDVEDLASASSRLSSPLPRVTAEEVMEALKERFPVWMWRNTVVRDFVEWLQHGNLRRALHSPTQQHVPMHQIPVALLGLDIYSMFASADQVVEYLDAVDPTLADRARKRYNVLQLFRPHEENYCRAVLLGHAPSQQNPVRKMVSDLDSKAKEFKNVFGDGDEYFNAHENARIVMAAEEYYRQSYLGTGLAWNVRDRAMAEMIVNSLQFHDEKLQQLPHLEHNKLGTDAPTTTAPKVARAVVWAHNSHIGDAAATEQYIRFGQDNVGHLVREALGKDACYLIGLSTATGTVRAARRWNGRDHVMELTPPLTDSTGDLLHQVATARMQNGQERDFGLVFRSNCTAEELQLAPEAKKACELLKDPRLERFVGVQYVKHTERQSHYSRCRLSEQFDLVVHLDHTTALEPLEEEEIAEPHFPMPSPSQTKGLATTQQHKTKHTTKKLSARPGTVDYSKWDKILSQYDDDDDEAFAVPP